MAAALDPFLRNSLRRMLRAALLQVFNIRDKPILDRLGLNLLVRGLGQFLGGTRISSQ